jgi:ribosomal protein S7
MYKKLLNQYDKTVSNFIPKSDTVYIKNIINKILKKGKSSIAFHSIVAGGFELMSYTTLFTPLLYL